MFGGIGNLANVMKQAMEMKGKLQEMQELVANLRFEADSGAGAVTATVNGKLELAAIKISPDTFKSGDVEMLEDLVRSAVCAAQRKAADGVRAEMAKLTGGMNIPGLDGLLGAK